MLRKFGFAVAVIAALVALSGQSRAADLPIKPKMMPMAKTLFGGTTGGAGLVSFVAVGFLGVVATMCAYDLYLKIEGVKNWDGTPKAAEPHNHHRAA
jgi:hypothetical protein